MAPWDRRLGLAVPSWNAVHEYEVQTLVVPAMSVDMMRIAVRGESEENLAWMALQVPAVAELLADARVNVARYECMASSFILGAGYDREIIRAIESTTETPATAAAIEEISAHPDRMSLHAAKSPRKPS